MEDKVGETSGVEMSAQVRFNTLPVLASLPISNLEQEGRVHWCDYERGYVIGVMI